MLLLAFGSYWWPSDQFWEVIDSYQWLYSPDDLIYRISSQSTILYTPNMITLAYIGPKYLRMCEVFEDCENYV